MYVPTRPRRPGDPPPAPLGRQLMMAALFFASMAVVLAVAFYLGGGQII